MVGVGGGLRRLSLTCNALLLLCIGLQDAKASSCQHVFHKKVGDTVEFSSCLPTEGVSSAKWKYGESIMIAGIGLVPGDNQFKGRLDLNPTNFSLTVRKLTLRDSGVFSFISATDGEQRPSVIITLQVHEPLTTRPTVTLDPTWHASNESCTFLLRCNCSDDNNVNYTWTVRNKNTSGSWLQYIATTQDGEIEFKCTVNNFISQMSASVTRKCSNNTEGIRPEPEGNFAVILYAAVGGCLLVVVIVGVAVGVHSWKKSQIGSPMNDLTVYADISEVTSDAGSTMKPSSEYETIGHSVNTVTPMPHTVYDKIQFSRVRDATVSPYQEIS